ncbi:protein of unknown function [Filimonas lacunae]|uniref:BT-3987-like N-terminal domain-containing protein n=1 Tax=Filimonas lacunae TaxID=477680 RepID=A0A173MJ70_9BACT|nr:DUF1735 domain-containing protein [Filimonas lacunae]BAV07540.1 hypothetical protein FLA_3566 [Filimonas lacunae]SIT30022.1 protein of unknown function [Filimonas lacunae]
MKTNRPSHTYALLLVLVAAVTVFACKKEDDALTSLARELSNYKFSYVQSGSAVRLNGIAYEDTTLTYRGFAVSLTGAASHEVVVDAVIDPSLVASYNALYSESNPSFDTSSFKVSYNGVFTIAANATTATDSLFIKLKSATRLKDSTTYLVPVRLTARTGEQVATSIVFFKFFVAATSVDVYMNGADYFSYYWAYNRSGSLYYPIYFTRDENGKITGPESLSFSSFARTRLKSQEMHVYAVTNVSDSLIKAFSASTGYSYQAFPAGTYSLAKNKATIPANAYLSSDSVKVNFTNYEAFETGKYYLLGLQIVREPTDALSAPPAATTSFNGFALVSFYVYP